VVTQSLNSDSLKSKLLPSARADQKGDAVFKSSGSIIGYFEEGSGFLVESMSKVL